MPQALEKSIPLAIGAVQEAARRDVSPLPEVLKGPSGKLMGLEVLRFTAALSVLFWHYQNLWYTPSGLRGFAVEAQPMYAYFGFLYRFGLYGVQFFWAISGYVFFWKYHDAIAGGRISGREFFILRFSRLYPLHFVTLVLVAILQSIYTRVEGFPFVYGHNDAINFVLQLFMASNWGPNSTSSFNGPIWSISVEVLVYIGFFLTLRYAGGSIWLTLAIILAAAAAYLFDGHNPIFQCIVLFYVGGLSSILATSALARMHRSLIFGVALGLLILLPIGGELGGAERHKTLMQLLLVVYIPVILYMLAEYVRIPRMLNGWVQTAGNMTYSSYLIHFPMQLAVAIVCACAGVAIPKEHLWFFLLYFGSILLLAGLVFRTFEMPWQRLIRRRLGARQA